MSLNPQDVLDALSTAGAPAPPAEVLHPLTFTLRQEIIQAATAYRDAHQWWILVVTTTVIGVVNARSVADGWCPSVRVHPLGDVKTIRAESREGEHPSTWGDVRSLDWYLLVGGEEVLLPGRALPAESIARVLELIQYKWDVADDGLG